MVVGALSLNGFLVAEGWIEAFPSYVDHQFMVLCSLEEVIDHGRIETFVRSLVLMVLIPNQFNQIL
jgi:hypothetical protein